jgi:hypothetical protein
MSGFGQARAITKVPARFLLKKAHMRAQTIICDAHDPTRGRCGAHALVHQIHYRYEPGPDWMPDAEKILTEMSYDIACPRCGYRVQAECVQVSEEAV